MSNTKQTAVMWLREQFHKVPQSQFGNLFEQALAMERKQSNNQVLVHTGEREADVQKVCQEVIYSAVEWEYRDNSYDRYVCRFCHEHYPDNNEDPTLSRKKVVHKQDCPYLIAKDLSTNM